MNIKVGDNILIKHINLANDSTIIPCGSIGKYEDWIDMDNCILKFKVNEEVKTIILDYKTIELLEKSDILVAIKEPKTTNKPKYHKGQMVEHISCYYFINKEPIYDEIEGDYQYEIIEIDSLLFQDKERFDVYENEIKLIDDCKFRLYMPTVDGEDVIYKVQITKK